MKRLKIEFDEIKFYDKDLIFLFVKFHCINIGYKNKNFKMLVS